MSQFNFSLEMHYLDTGGVKQIFKYEKLCDSFIECLTLVDIENQSCFSGLEKLFTLEDLNESNWESRVLKFTAEVGRVG